jgi:TRAP-type C4-dicarboxylate transport system permease small subunit
MGPPSTLLRAFDRLVAALGMVVGVSLGAIAILMALDIFVRYFGFGSLPWVIEVTEYLMFAGAFLAAPWALRLGVHVRVDMLLTALSRPAARALERALDAVGFVVSAAMAAYGVRAVVEALTAKAGGGGMVYKTWTYPEWVLLLPVPIGMACLAVEFALRFFRVGAAAPQESAAADKTRL